MDSIRRSKADKSILLVARQLGQGGSERQLAVAARGLLRSGRFQPRVGTLRAGGFRLQELERDGIESACFHLTSFAAPGQVWRASRALRRYVREHNAAIVHSYDTPGNLLAAPAAFGAARILTSQRAHRELSSPRERLLLRVTDRLAYRIVVNCKFLERHLIEDEGVRPEKIRLCYNGIDAVQFQPAGRPRPEKLREAGLTVGVVCALRPEKDLLTLAEGFALARREAPGLTLVVTGDGPEREPLERRLEQLGVREAAYLEPATAEVAPWLRAIDIFVLPSKSEALSNSLMEAMACGCAAVASHVGGNPELVRSGETGLLFPPGDAGALAACLVRLASEETLRRRLAETALGRIRREFTLDASARRMEEIYAEAVE